MLFDTLRELLADSLELLKAGQDSPSFLSPLTSFDFEAKGDNVVGPSNKWTWIPSIDINEHIKGHVVASARAKCFADDELHKRLGFVAMSALGGGQRSFEQIYRYSVLEAYVMLGRTYNFDAAVFSTIYTDFERELFADARRLKSMLPVCGLEAGEWLQRSLDAHVTFRQLTPDELGPCVRSQAVPFEIWDAESFYVSSSNHWALVGEVDLPVSYYEPSTSPEDITLPPLVLPNLRSNAGTIVEAIRLFGGSVVATRQVTPIPFTKFDFIGSRLDEFWVKYSSPDPENCVRVSEDMSATFWETFESLKKNDTNAVAVRRLVSSALRNDSEDALIDLSIALETLFSDPGNGSEITERIALRAALVAPGINLDPNRVRIFIRRAYSARSQIAHGQPLSTKKIQNLAGDPCDLDAMVRDLDSFLRTVILRALRDSELLAHDANLERALSGIK